MSRHNSFRKPHHYSFEDERRVVYAHDLSGNFTFLNAQGERLLGYSCEEACRMNISEIVAPESAPQVREQILSDTSRMIGAVYAIQIVAKDGHRVPVEVSTRLVHQPGRGAEIEGLAIPSVTSDELDTEFFYGIWLMR
ncbi:MAG: PAS domain-containing protein [Pyrinomonadaceae bacterium]